MAEELSREDFQNLLSRIIQVPREEVDFSFKYEADWTEPFAFARYGDLIHELEEYRQLVEQLAFFTMWLLSKAREDEKERVQLTDSIEREFSRVEEWLASLPDPPAPYIWDDFFTTLSRPTHGSPLSVFYFGPKFTGDRIPPEARLTFELIEAYRENPFFNRAKAKGGVIAMLVFIITLGTAQVIGEAGAGVCRQQYGALIDHQMQSFEKIAIYEGRPSAEIIAAQKKALRAMLETMRGCDTALHKSDPKITDAAKEIAGQFLRRSR
jgi:hypothetical protein